MIWSGSNLYHLLSKQLWSFQVASYQPSWLLSSPFSTLNPKTATSFTNRSGHITLFFNLFNYSPLSTAPWLNTKTYPLVLRAQVCSGLGICSRHKGLSWAVALSCLLLLGPTDPQLPASQGSLPTTLQLSLLHHLLSWTPCLPLAAFIPQFASLIEILWEYSFPLLLFL